MAGRRVIKPRFFIFLAIVILIPAFFIVRHILSSRTTLAVVMQGATSNTVNVQAVIIRDEVVESADSVARVEYIAKEGDVVSQGDELAYIYSTGYTESELNKLEATREEIQEYHKELLSNIVDAQLDKLDSVVDERAAALRNTATGLSQGNITELLAQLETSMVTRQEYMRQNKREDTKLTKLYNEENSRLSNISTWRKTLTADSSGVVTFYLDGYENDLSFEDAEDFDSKVFNEVINSERPSEDSRDTGICKIVDQTDWKIGIVDSSGWNPVNGQNYIFKLDSVPDIQYNALVQSVQKNGDQITVVLSCTDPIGPLLRYRSGAATLEISLTGLSVPLKALKTEGGQTGVMVYDGVSYSFVAVDVLKKDSDNALVQPVEDGMLTVGMRVIENQ